MEVVLIIVFIVVIVCLLLFPSFKEMIKEQQMLKNSKKETDSFILENQEKYNFKLMELNDKKRKYISNGGIEDKKNKYNRHTIEVILIDENSVNFLIQPKPLYDYHYSFYSYLNNDVSNLQIEYSYNYDDVKYYKLDGSVHKEQQITGGGGGGSSLKGAIVGGVVAGEVGAIIGSRKKVDEIKTTYNTVDDRILTLTLNDNTTFNLNYQCYEKLLDYIPEKEYDNYIENKKIKGKDSI